MSWEEFSSCLFRLIVSAIIAAILALLASWLVTGWWTVASLLAFLTVWVGIFGFWTWLERQCDEDEAIVKKGLLL